MNNKYKREISKLIMIMIIILLIGIVVFIYNDETKTMSSVLAHVSDDVISFSEKSGYYHNKIKLKLSPNFEFPSDAKIYYTLDGNNPTIESTEYTKPIELELGDDIKVYPVKAIVYYKNEYSKIYQNTYVLSKQNNEINLPIMNLTVDRNDLYNGRTGIMMNNNTVIRTEEFIRDGNLVLFEEDGNIVFNQDIRVSLFGNSSAYYNPVKSFKIRAKADEKIYFDLYESEESYTSIISEYNNIKLRSGSSDMKLGNIRESIMSRLANNSNFDGCSDTCRALLYLNGKYYGLFDIEQNYSESFLKNKYGLDSTDKIESIKGRDNYVTENSELNKLITNDLNDEKNRKELEKKVDIDNFLYYCAIEVLCNNTDWPNNNYGMWRYIGGYDGYNKYTDGRYRFLIYDSDCIYYSLMEKPPFLGSNEDTLVSIIKNDEEYIFAYNSTLGKILKSDYYKSKFTGILLDLLNTSFKTENIIEVIDQEWDKVKDVREQKDKEKYVNDIKQCVYNREGEIHNDIKNYFNYVDKYSLTLNNTKGIVVSWNNYMNIYQKEIYNNEYYKEVEFEMKASTYPGYKFDYWIVNGNRVEGNSLIITEELIKDGKIEINTVSSIDNSASIIISEISARSDSDWIKITNIGEKNINLNSYYISDSEKNYKKYQLPNIVLKSKESIMVNGKKNYYSIGDYICNFNLNEEESVYIYDSANNKVIDKVKVPKMQKTESYGRYDNSCIFKFFNNLNNERKNIDK